MKIDVGDVHFMKTTTKSKASPLDVPGVKLGLPTEDLVAIVREGRERSGR
jgi:hypothetical protein